MSNLIIHIGLHKTGTTYLQYDYFKRLGNVVYVHGNNFFKPWRDQLSLDNRHLLMSYEGFSGVPWISECINESRGKLNWLNSFETNICQLSKYFPEASIIVVFRKHGELFTSMYKQYIQSGGTLNITDFKNTMLNTDSLDFKSRIDILKQNFQDVYFLNYHNFVDQGDVYFDNFLFKTFGIVTNQKSKTSKKSNKSIDGQKLELLRSVNKYYLIIPIKIRKVLRYVRLSPRDILQNRLSFWESEEKPEYMFIRNSVDKDMADDWYYFLKHEWTPK